MVKVYVATALNFFFPGAGYLLLGKLLGLPFLVGAIGLTYVELGIQEPLPSLYWVMFASVFIMNTGFAIHTYGYGRGLVASAGATTS